MSEWIKKNKGELIIAIVPSLLTIPMVTIVIRQLIINRFSDFGWEDKIIFATCGAIAAIWVLISYCILDFKDYMRGKSK